ncbi:MAG: aryl-sulfate sulfotransferase, partial [Clostridium sp.]|nr:aryl-sulfate sulfotransferase [Clostridium sp.]
PAVIPFYDNSGILRSVIPLENYRTDRIEFVNGNMVYSYSNKGFAVVAPNGKLVKVLSLRNYRLHHDFVYNGYGQLWCLASDTNQRNTEKDCVISVNMDSGKIKKLVDFGTLLSGVKNAAAKADSARPLNWLELNSIVRVGSSDIIVSSRELSTIIRVNSVTSSYPKLGYLISDSAIWEKTKYQKYLLTKGAYVDEKWYNLNDHSQSTDKGEVRDFCTQFGQNSVSCVQSSQLAEEQYYLTMLNNNYGFASTLPNVKWSAFAGIGRRGRDADCSHFYEYIVDEKAGYYGLHRSFGVPYTAQGGSASRNGSNIIIGSMNGKSFGEYDENGRLIREFSLKAYRVYKYDLKNYWFY